MWIKEAWTILLSPQTLCQMSLKTGWNDDGMRGGGNEKQKIRIFPHPANFSCRHGYVAWGLLEAGSITEEELSDLLRHCSLLLSSPLPCSLFPSPSLSLTLFISLPQFPIFSQTLAHSHSTTFLSQLISLPYYQSVWDCFRLMPKIWPNPVTRSPWITIRTPRLPKTTSKPTDATTYFETFLCRNHTLNNLVVTRWFDLSFQV